jgi:phytoene dehydrogenase-like protein
LTLTYDAIIVGGGVGGCVVGALLARNGLKVLLLEADATLGGRSSSYRYKGYTVDVGGHVINDLETCGLALAIRLTGAQLPLTALNPPYKIYDWERGLLTPTDYVRQHHSVNAFAKLDNIQSILAKTTPVEARQYENTSLSTWLETYLDSEGVDALLDWTMHGCQPVSKRMIKFHSAAAFIRDYGSILRAKGSFLYPKHGGIAALPYAFADVIERCGGDIITCAKVNKILVKDSAVQGIQGRLAKSVYVKDFEAEAPIIVSNLPVTSLFNIFPKDACSGEFINEVEEWRKATIIRAVGLVGAARKEIIQPCWLTFVVDPPAGIESAGRAGMGRRAVFIPSFVSDTVAPNGFHYFLYETLHSEPPSEAKRQEIWSEMQTEVENLYPQLKSNYEWMHHYYTSSRIYGRSIGFTGNNKPDVELKDVKGLFFTGDSFRGLIGEGGGGIWSAVDSALNCTHRILQRKGTEAALNLAREIHHG